jgi:hypothetical protein
MRYPLEESVEALDKARCNIGSVTMANGHRPATSQVEGHERVLIE